MDNSSVIYCLDTSAFLDGWSRYYPPEIFISLWENIDLLIESGNIISSIVVLDELKRKDDEIFKWCKERQHIFCEIDDETQNKVTFILSKYERLVDTKSGKSGGDPFVIALAMSKKTNLTVVTGELGGSPKSPKIPYVCKQENIACINFLDLIKEQKWKF